MNQEKIGKFIAEKRKESNLTQIQFAEKLGVTNKSVSRWETGKNMPDISLFIPICEILGITVNELIIGEEIKNNETAKEQDVIIETIKTSNKKLKLARILIYIVAILLLNHFTVYQIQKFRTPSNNPINLAVSRILYFSRLAVQRLIQFFDSCEHKTSIGNNIFCRTILADDCDLVKLIIRNGNICMTVEICLAHILAAEF